MHYTSSRKKTENMTKTALLMALVVVLQMLSALVSRFTALPFSITLTLIPIVLGAAMMGIGTGAFLGGVFGTVVLINAIVGLDAGGNILWNANPLLTILLCLAKGIGAGAMAGLAIKLLHKRPKLSMYFAASLAPITNTGLFILSMVLFFHDVLVEWAGGTALVSYIITGLCGINFLIELAVNIILAPTCLHMLSSIQKQHIQDSPYDEEHKSNQ